MVQCPICKEELSKQIKEGWLCENCNEVVPKQFAESPRPQCSCGHNH